MTHAEILAGIVQYAQIGDDVVRILSEHGLVIVPKEIPEAFACEHGFDHDDTEEYAAMVEHLAVRP